MTHTNTDFYGFSADRPIESASEDLLGRSDFAKNLGEAIYNWKGKDSLVVALYGEWGSGKSSIKNMALSHLRQKGSHKPTIIEFSPWEWAAQEKITKAFFDEISKAIGREDKSEKNEKLAAIFKKYGNYLSLGEVVLSSTSSSIPTLLPILAGIGALSSLFDSTIITTTIMATLAIYMGVMKWGAEILKSLSENFDTKSKDSQKSLHEIREELSVILQDRDSSILIVMDDLDRLTSPELRMIFQLVKANTVFPNVTFLLLFQKNIIEQRLTDSTQSGREYLEKIIQVPFDVPKVESLKVYNILASKLESILEIDESFKTQFNQQRWENIFHAGLRQYFKNLRNIYRYASTLAFHFSILKGRKIFEANPVDLIGIECIRVFEPEVYTELSLNKDAFTNNGSNIRDNEDKNLYRQKVEFTIEKAKEENRQYVKEILTQLFPTIEWILGNHFYTGDISEKWFSESRVCHKQNFDQYFQLSTRSDGISKSDLVEFVELTNDSNKLKRKILSLNQGGKLKEFLSQFELYSDQVPIENAQSYINALLDTGDLVDSSRLGFFDIFSPQDHLYRLSVWLLKRIEDKTKRATLLSDYITASNGLHILTRILISEEQSRQDQEETLLEETDLSNIKVCLIRKIRLRANSHPIDFIKSTSFISLMYRWKRWDDEIIVRNWAEQQTLNIQDLLLFLSSMIEESHSYSDGDYTSKINKFIKISTLEDFLEVQRIENLINGTDKSQLSENELEVVRLFDEALERRRNGKEDNFF